MKGPVKNYIYHFMNEKFQCDVMVYNRNFDYFYLTELN